MRDKDKRNKRVIGLKDLISSLVTGIDLEYIRYSYMNLRNVFMINGLYSTTIGISNNKFFVLLLPFFVLASIKKSFQL